MPPAPDAVYPFTVLTHSKTSVNSLVNRKLQGLVTLFFVHRSEKNGSFFKRLNSYNYALSHHNLQTCMICLMAITRYGA